MDSILFIIFLYDTLIDQLLFFYVIVYMLAVKTGSSGTDRRVSVNLVDKNGEETGYIYVDQKKINNWEAYQWVVSVSLNKIYNYSIVYTVTQ